MPTEQEWTVGTLYAHFDARLRDMRESIGNAIASADKAVSKAEAATERRFESVNEFRNTLKDQAATFITRNDYDSRNQAVADKIAALETRLNAHDSLTKGRSQGISAIGAIVLGALAGLASAATMSAMLFNIFNHH